jgi:polyisoprenyl-phosphate glycosyltransferase
MKPLISLVVPVYNEELNIGPFHEAVLQAIAPLEDEFAFEFVFTDNHSEDNTFAELSALAQRDSRVRVFRFSRNFGYQRSILTGYSQTRGDAAIQLDVDLQDPPELIERFLREWQAGADVVYGVRTARQEGVLITLQRRVFYRLIDMLSEHPLPRDAGDFRLVSRRIIDLLVSFSDAQPYLRGTIATLGFKQVGIPYERAARVRGTSKFPFVRLVSLAIDGILNHSTLPLRMATFIGLGMAVAAFLLAAGYALGKLLFHTNWPAGFTTLVALILFGTGLNAMLLGVIGEYLARIYRQMRKEPLSIVEQTIDNTV